MPGHVYQFGPFRLDEGARLLQRDGEPVSITPKVFDTLVFLVSNAGRTVSREEMIKAVWPDTFVEEGNLNYNMSQLRKTLGEREPGVPYVQTIPRVGYRFVADMSQRVVEEAVQLAPAAPRMPGLQGILVAALVVVTAGAVLWLWNARGKATSVRLNLRQLTRDSDYTGSPALSPDGKLVAYSSDRLEPGRSDIWVQQTAGGPPLKLTKAPGNHVLPAFSGDGSNIYFTSWSAPQGIYKVPTLGGDSLLVATNGLYPSASPDGRNLAYVNLQGEAYILPTGGGTARLVAPGFSNTGERPIWSPDSGRILFDATKTGQPETADFWVFSISGGSPEKTGWFRWASEHKILKGHIGAWLPGDVIVIAATIGDTTQIYRTRITSPGWQLGELEPLTFGTAQDIWPSGASGRIAFQSGGPSGQGVWMLPADANSGRAIGLPKKLTFEKAPFNDVSSTPDGKTLVFCSKREAASDIYALNTDTGKESLVVTDQEQKHLPLISTDGTTVVYTVSHDFGRGRWSVFAASLRDLARRKICDDCGPAFSRSPDGKTFLAARTDGGRRHISVVDIDSGRSTVILEHPRYDVNVPSFSPDGKWIVFFFLYGAGGGKAFSDLVVAPFRGATAVPEREWIKITDAPGKNQIYWAFWSPNGELLYYVDAAGGQKTLWALHLDRHMRAVGTASRVFPFSARAAPNASFNWPDPLTAVPGGIVGAMGEYTSNIWLMDLPR